MDLAPECGPSMTRGARRTARSTAHVQRCPREARPFPPDGKVLRTRYRPAPRVAALAAADFPDRSECPRHEGDDAAGEDDDPRRPLPENYEDDPDTRREDPYGRETGPGE